MAARHQLRPAGQYGRSGPRGAAGGCAALRKESVAMHHGGPVRLKQLAHVGKLGDVELGVEDGPEDSPALAPAVLGAHQVVEA
ncbi:MAG: hypothetical protein ACK55Z_08195, partial [bacterium]